MSNEQLQGLLQFCKTTNQKNIFETLIACNCDVSAAAAKLQMHARSVYKVTKRVADYAATVGYDPEHDLTHSQNENFIVKGVSTYYNKEGKKAGQWVKTNLRADAEFKMMQAAVLDLMESVSGAYTPTIAPIVENNDIMTVYNLGDPHVGMLAWDKETGEDFDLIIAEKDLRMAMKSLVASSPASKQALIVDLGDFFHSDSMDNATRKSGNALDVDSRWAKVLKIGLNIMIELVVEALTKHETVKVINAIGNHNEHSAVFISTFLQAWFKNEPRVIIDDSPALFTYHKFGKCLVGVTHGHTTKAHDLPEIMAYDCQDIWSDTLFRYWYTGHVHHDTTKEYRTCKVETFRTLAGRDAWHAGQGYRSGRDMKAIVLHKLYGEIQRNTVNVIMLRDTAQN